MMVASMGPMRRLAHPSMHQAVRLVMDRVQLLVRLLGHNWKIGTPSAERGVSEGRQRGALGGSEPSICMTAS